MANADVVVVGGGIIGLAIGWRTAQRGLTVTVVDPTPMRGASYAAAGMLTPVTEAQFGEESLLALNLDSARRYPAFVEELGEDVGYRSTGTLAVASDAGDRAVLVELHAYQQQLGLQAELLSGRECRSYEPMLASTVRAGLLAAGDRSVDPRRLTPALRRAGARAGVRVLEQQVISVEAASVTLAGGDRLSAAQVVVAAGCWSAQLVGLPVRPVKGQILRLRGPGFLDHTVRGVVRGSHVYVVPRDDGELVVGATMEEMGFDTTVRAGAVYELLRDAHELLPGITELELVEVRAGLRPGSPDNAPIVGSLGAGVVAATGHHRNGVLLAPVTADAVADLLTTGELPTVMRPFRPDRFIAAAATTAAAAVPA